jgi:hypothetical protein
MSGNIGARSSKFGRSCYTKKYYYRGKKKKNDKDVANGDKGGGNGGEPFLSHSSLSGLPFFPLSYTVSPNMYA